MTKQVTPTQAAYAAGILDGEGCIWAAVTVPSYLITIMVQMAKPQVVDWLHSVYGGKRYANKSKFVKGGMVYSWQLSGTKILPFVDSVRPYVVLKAAQLELASGFAKTMFGNLGRGHNIDEATLLLRYKIAEALGQLNRKREGQDPEVAALSSQPEELSSARKEDVQ